MGTYNLHYISVASTAREEELRAVHILLFIAQLILSCSDLHV